jgi:multiple sugar transport system substrate-binding protein
MRFSRQWLGAERRGKRLLTALTAASAVGVLFGVAACSGGGANDASQRTRGVTISVALGAPPPAEQLKEFTNKTGIKVKWTNIDWDSLQTKISAAAAAKTYFADATDVDWSRVGQLGKLGWFIPMNTLLDTKAMAPDMPQLASFTEGGKVVGIPYDASFMVTTVNKNLFKKAGITATPTTIDEYTSDLQKVKSAGVVKYPLNIPFSAAEGLSTYWYETTGAFGGTVLTPQGKPAFSSPDSAGYKAAVWMVNAIKTGLVPPGNINVADSQGQQTLMAKGQVASTFSDYSGNVGTLYNIKSTSSVVGDTEYIPTPGVSGPVGNLSNPDGIGVPKEAKYPKAAAELIKWFTSAEQQANFTGLNGTSKVYSGFTIPSRLSVVKKMSTSGNLDGGEELTTMLKTAKPVFPGGAPTYYPKFSNAVYTNLHAAATGSMTAAAAIKAISDTANQLAQSAGS